VSFPATGNVVVISRDAGTSIAVQRWQGLHYVDSSNFIRNEEIHLIDRKCHKNMTPYAYHCSIGHVGKKMMRDTLKCTSGITVEGNWDYKCPTCDVVKQKKVSFGKISHLDKQRFYKYAPGELCESDVKFIKPAIPGRDIRMRYCLRLSVMMRS